MNRSCGQKYKFWNVSLAKPLQSRKTANKDGYICTHTSCAMKFDVQGKTILLTGASDGIGKALAIFLIGQGARLAVHYHTNGVSAESIVARCSNGSETFRADLSDEKEVSDLFTNVVARFKRIDTMVLNAGVFLPHSVNGGTVEWFQTWKRTMAVNLDAVGLLTKLGIDHFKTLGRGRLIYLGSRAVFRGETEAYLAYAASKGGITALARSVARSFGKDGIVAMVLAPGFTRTAMAEAFIADHGEETLLNEIALKELTEPEDLAPLLCLMCSGAMDHATGATIDMNAGSHIR